MRLLAIVLISIATGFSQDTTPSAHSLFLQKINGDMTQSTAYYINASSTNGVMLYNPATNLYSMIPLTGGIVFTGSTVSINTAQITVSLTTSSTNVALTAASATHQIFTGNTGTYTLPNVAGSTGKVFFIKNKGSGNLLVTSFSGSQVYVTGTTDGVIMAPGDARIFVNDSQTFTVE